MKNKLFVFMFFLMPLLSTTVFTNLSSLFSFAEEHNLSLKEVNLELEKQRYDILIAKRRKLFTLELQSSYMRVSKLMELELPFLREGILFGTKNTYDFSLLFNQPVFTGGKLSANVQIKKLEKSEKEQEKRIIQNKVYTEIARLYYTGVIAELQKEILLRQKAFLKEFLQDTEKLYKGGQIDYIEVLQVRKKLNEMEMALRELEDKINRTRIRIFNLIGMDNFDGEIKFRAEPRLKPLPIVEKIINPEISLLAEKEKKLQQIIKFQKSSMYPQVFIMGRYSYGKPGIDLIKKEWMGYWNVGISASFTLWNWKTTNMEFKKVAVDLEKLRNRRQKLLSNIKAQLENLKSEYEKNVALISLWDERISLIKKVLQIKQEQFRQNQIIPTELLKVNTELEEAELKKMESLSKALLSRIEYITTSGLSIKEEL
ncbi:MAG: TolC family protein [Candidatus Aminicenantes bacterium]|nr:TolC family protein [Candidatus Aminicenantes bacterium]